MNSSLHQKRRNTNPHHTCPYYMRCNSSFWSRCRASNVVIYLLSISHGNSPSSKNKKKTSQKIRMHQIPSLVSPASSPQLVLHTFYNAFLSPENCHTTHMAFAAFSILFCCVFFFCFHSINTERQQTASPTKNNVCTSETSNPVQNKNTKKKQRCIWVENEDATLSL